MKKEEQNVHINLLSLMPSNLKKVFGIAISVCGLNVFGMLGIFGYICSNKDFFLEYFEFFMITLVILTSIIIVCFIIIIITLCTLILRINPFIESYNINLEECKSNCCKANQNMEKADDYLSEFKKQNTLIENGLNGFAANLDRFDKIITELEIAGNIINKNKLMEIEKTVPPNADIIIFSSKYVLDEEFMSIIINNIKRGVTYKYIVTGANTSSPNHLRFTKIVQTWFDKYVESVDVKKHNKLAKVSSFDKSSSKMLNKRSIENNATHFFNHVKEYNSPLAYDILTIMLYQKKGGNGDYHVIINLPSEKEGYYSYILPDNNAIKQSIIDGIIYMCKREKEFDYRGEGYEN